MADDEADSVREAARRRDREDPLAAFADRFEAPGLYMDGNSLGPIGPEAEATLQRAIDQWRELGVTAWTGADPPWFHYGELLGDRLAGVLGAHPHECVAANGTTVNIHALGDTFLDDGTVLVDELDFPTDHYAVRAQLRRRGADPDEQLVVVESRDGRTIEEADVEAALEAHDDVELVFLPSVLYRSGQLLDVERLTAAAHDAGALAGFDLAHSVGVVPHDLHGAGVDFAVWCSYKYLNAGPGAVGGLYVHERHHDARPALPGWWGHEKETMFEMRPTFTPAEGAGRFQISTVPVLAAAPLFGALDVLAEAGIERVREKSVALTELLVDLVDAELADTAYAVGSPRDPVRRGGHVAVEHPEAAGISAALRERDVLVDHRPPDVVRVCPAPLYTSFEDIVDVVEHLRAVVAGDEHLDASVGDVT